MTLNLKRFQFAVNHTDPQVVLAGLREFLDLLLNTDEHLRIFFEPTSSSIRKDQSFEIVEYPNVQPILSTFFASSPQAEEFFSLWEFPTIEYDSELCAMDMNCLAAVVECLPPSSPFLLPIINRINTSSSKFILFQLDKKNYALRNSVLRLLIAVQRKARVADEFLHHFMLSTYVKNSIAKQSSDDDQEEGKQPEDSIYFIEKLLFSALVFADTDSSISLLSHGNNFESLIDALPKISIEAYQLFLNGLINLFNKGFRIQEQLSHKLLTKHCVQCIFSAAEANSAKQDSCDGFLELAIESLIALMLSQDSKRIRQGISSYLARKLLTSMVSVLKPTIHPLHARAQVEVVKIIPEMCHKCMLTIGVSWEPIESEEYYHAVKHLNELLTFHTAPLPPLDSICRDPVGALHLHLCLPAGNYHLLVRYMWLLTMCLSVSRIRKARASQIGLAWVVRAAVRGAGAHEDDLG